MEQIISKRYWDSLISKVCAAVGLPKSRPWLTVKNSSDGDITDMLINGTIGQDWWDMSGTSSRQFRDELSKIPKGKTIHVRINSEGGAVGDALEIYNVLKERAEDVTCIVDGYALSSASIIALGGGRTVMQEASLMMIHEPWSVTQGDEMDHLRAAEMLDKHGDTIAGIYATKTGKSQDEMRELMRKESWFTGPEAVDFGLADSVTKEDDDEEEELQNRPHFTALDLSKFKNIPQHIFAMLRPISAPNPGRGNAGAAASTSQTQIHNMNDTQTVAAAPAAPPAGAAANPPSPASPPLVTNVPIAEYDRLRNQLESERRIRITAEVTRRAENRVENKNLAWWINLAMTDEVGTYGQLDALPENLPGGNPLRPSITIVDDRMRQIKEMPTARARFDTLKNEWAGLIQDASVRDNRAFRSGVRNENTYQSSLVTQFLVDGATTILQNRWAPLRVFTRDYSVDRYKPRATGQLKFVTGGSTTLTNATNFESGDAVVANAAVSVSQYTQAFHVTNDQLNSGLRMENLMEINIAGIADKILNVAFTPVTAAAYNTLPKIISSPTAFSFSDMATAWGELKKSPIKYMLLDGEYMARIVNTPSFFQMTGDVSGAGWQRFGWDGVFLNTNWTGTVTTDLVRGFFCNPQALGAIAGLPLVPPAIPGATLQEGSFMVPEVDITVATFSWFSLSTRTFWMSYDLMFGASALDTTAGGLITSG